MLRTLDDYFQVLVSDLNLITEQTWASKLVSFGGESAARADCDQFIDLLESSEIKIDESTQPLFSKFQRKKVCDPVDRGQSLLVGNRKYLLVDQLGSGGQAQVYLARTRSTPPAQDQMVAVKIVNLIGLTQIAFERWSRECRILCDPARQTLDGAQHVVKGIEAITEFDRSVLVMEWVPGRTLKEISDELQNRCARISVRHAMLLIDSVLKGLQSLHESGCIHRDIKPANLIHVETLDDRYFVRIVDLGLIKIIDESLTDPYHRMGTLYYSAPECFSDITKVDARAGLYGLAATFCGLVCGEPPAFELRLVPRPISSKEMSDWILWIGSEKPWNRMRLDEIRSDVPTKLADLISSCLEPDPEKRPKNVLEFRKTFDSILNDLQSGRNVQRRMQAIRLGLIKILSETAKDYDRIPKLNNAVSFLASIRRQFKSRKLLFPDGCRLPIQCRDAVDYNKRLNTLYDNMNSILQSIDDRIREHRTDFNVEFTSMLLEFQRLLPTLLSLEHRLADCLGEAMS